MQKAQVLVLSFLFASAWAHAEAYVGQRMTFSSWKPKAGEPQGCISGSIGRLKSGDTADSSRSGLSLNIQEDKDFATTHRISVVEYTYDKPANKRNDYSDRDSFGKVFTICFRPGNYAVTYICLSEPGSFKCNERNFIVPFTIVDGQNTYVGNFALTPPRASDCMNARRTTHPVQISDHSERDLPLIMAAKSHPSSAPAVQLLDPGARNPFLVLCISPD